MRYKQFGKTGLDVSRLGFGCMRFPSSQVGGKTVYDEEESIRMLRRAVELGVNYFDSAPGYCDTMSEVIVGKAFRGMREKVLISTKNPIENASGDDFEKRLEQSLSRLNMDYIDFYHFWGIGLEDYETMIDVPDGPLSRALRLRGEGVLRHLSFSFHDKPENMIEIIRCGDGVFASVLCQYNLLDRANEASIAFAAEKGLGVVIMGPVGGGRLGTPSDVIRGMVKKDIFSTAEMALRFVLANNNVDIALSGMHTIEQVEENASVAAIEGVLTQEELEQIDRMLEENKRLAELYCTGCKYCMPCPQGVNIPHVFSLMNNHRIYGLSEYARKEYASLAVPLDKRGNSWDRDHGLDASYCIGCKECEGKCPQKLQIVKQLKDTHTELSS